jgi:hypothetical protein
MKTLTSLSLVTVLAATFLLAPGSSPAAKPAGPMVGHMVFFDLKDPSAANRDKVLATAKQYLSGHDGAVYFSVGTIAEDLKRDVNDRDFSVALHIVFEDKAAHDRYQTHERHLKFIAETKDLWKKVRVFDAYLSPAADAAKASGKAGN